MARQIDSAKLKAAAEHLNWVLQQYPDSDDVQSLLRSLTPLIEDAKAGRVTCPVERNAVPGAYNFGDGLYLAYVDPNVGDAYTEFRTELRGGLTEQDKRALARMQAIRGEETHHG